jgi:hypothetical protein
MRQSIADICLQGGPWTLTVRHSHRGLVMGDMLGFIALAIVNPLLYSSIIRTIKMQISCNQHLQYASLVTDK